MGKISVLIVAHFFWDNYEKHFITHSTIFFTLIPHLYYLAKIYIKIILYE